MPGPPRKPSNLRKFEGVRGRHRPLVPDLPAPADPLVKPAGLSAEESKVWATHVGWVRALSLESKVDGAALEAAVRHYCRAREAERTVAKEGLIVRSKSKNGQMLRPHPAVSIAMDSWKAYSMMAQQFGLTPAARAKLGAGDREREDDFASDVRGMKGAKQKGA